jgi:5-methylcytosine-specific restriction endonuclease McrA
MSLGKKAVREHFRCVVFDRDDHKCVFCERTEHLDAHHIVNRNDMPNGGYILSNGVTLCQLHHLQAENETITVAQIRKKIGP